MADNDNGVSVWQRLTISFQFNRFSYYIYQKSNCLLRIYTFNINQNISFFLHFLHFFTFEFKTTDYIQVYNNTHDNMLYANLQLKIVLHFSFFTRQFCFSRL